MNAAGDGLIGASVPRRKNRSLLSGEGKYVADVQLDGQVYARVVRSWSAYARLVGVDADEARAMPGVLTVITARDLPDVRIPIRLPFAESPEANEVLQPPLAIDFVRYVGEPIAVVVAVDPYIAEDASESIMVDLEECDPVLQVRPGTNGQSLVHESFGRNTINEFAYRYGDVDAEFAKADVVVVRRLRVHRHSAVPMETRGLLADFDASSGKLTVWGGAKVKHFTRSVISQALGIDVDKVRVIEVEVGGGFGARGEPYPEDILVPFLARMLERPVQWIEDRSEHMVATNHAREQEHDFELAATSDGDLLAFRSKGWVDQGAYVRSQGVLPSMLPVAHLPGPYEWAAFSIDVEAVLTNRTPVGTYRGPGMTAATFVRERMLDVLAAELSMDPVELRQKNMIRPESMPFSFAPGPGSVGVMPISYQSGDFGRAFEVLLETVDYAQLRRSQNEARDRGELSGIGVAAYVELGTIGPFEDVDLIPSANEVVVRTAVGSLGQGVETVLGQITADLLGLAFENVIVEFHDTDNLPAGFGAFASRSTVLAGNAVYNAVENMRGRAAALLECDPDQIVFEDGFAIGPEVRSVALKDIGETRGRFEKEGLTASFGSAISAVSVNSTDGRVTVERYVLAHDVGRAINPKLLIGQLAGAAAQGIGGALLEEFVYDENGQPLSVSLGDYMLPTVADLPEVEAIALEEPSTENPLGIKGGGEAGIVGTLGSLSNAVADAIGSDEDEVLESSISSQRVWRSMRRA